MYPALGRRVTAGQEAGITGVVGFENLMQEELEQGNGQDAVPPRSR